LARRRGTVAVGQRVGYVRVSTVDQNADRQLEGAALDRVFTDKASGKDTERPDALLAYVRDGDTVVVHSMDRLARNLGPAAAYWPRVGHGIRGSRRLIASRPSCRIAPWKVGQRCGVSQHQLVFTSWPRVAAINSQRRLSRSLATASLKNRHDKGRYLPGVFPIERRLKRITSKEGEVVSKRGGASVLVAIDQAEKVLTKVLLALARDRDLLVRAAKAQRSFQTSYSRFDDEAAGWADVGRVSECLHLMQVLRRTYEAAWVERERDGATEP
jgi:hypothetical protein